MTKIKRQIICYQRAEGAHEFSDQIAVEEPLEIILVYRNDKDQMEKRTWSITMRTPGEDEDLAVGYLFSEGLISSRQDIIRVHSKGVISNAIEIELLPNPELINTLNHKHTYTSSACGVCGKTTLDFLDVRGVYIHQNAFPLLYPEALFKAYQNLDKRQNTFNDTGGVHAAALFNADGHIEQIKEDVGRHNALDKLIGAAIKSDKIPLKEYGIILSGRCSFELIQKAHMAGISVIVSVGAPSSLAVELAEETGITLAGFIKDRKFNIYNDQGRIQHERKEKERE